MCATVPLLLYLYLFLCATVFLVRVRDCTYVLARVRETYVPVFAGVRDCTSVHILAR
jgi:hypothetical protein